MPQGQIEVEVRDYALEFAGVRGRTADEVSAESHIDTLCSAQRFIDSAVSKTVNVSGQVGGKGPGLTYNEFQALYWRAYKGGAKGCTTFNRNGKRFGIFRPVSAQETEDAACFIDPTTGARSCED